MAKQPDGSTKVPALRRQAEERLRATRHDVATMPVKDVQQLVYELQVHQIELEMQNEELLRAQVELEAARDRFLDLYDFAPTGHLTMDTYGTIVEANLRAVTLLGINRKDLIGQPLARFIARSDENTFHRHCQEVMKSGTRQTCEVQLGNTAGASRWSYLESLAIFDDEGRITQWRTSIMDVSDRKLAELSLLESEVRLQAMLRHSPSLIFLKDPKGRYLDVNQQFERTVHLTRQDIIGKTDRDIFPTAEATVFRAHDHKVWEAGRSLEFEEVMAHDGVSHTSIVSKFLLRRLDGTPYAICGIATDITERKRAEEARRSSEAFTHSVLNSLSAHVCVLDKDGFILKTNDAWNDFARGNLNRTLAGSDVGTNYLDLCRRANVDGESTAQMILGGIEAVLGGSQPSFSTEYPYHHHSPEEERWFLIRVTPLKSAQGVVISHVDISERVRMVRSLKQHNLMLGEKQEELESLAGKLIEAQEEERKRIARELHDDFNQRLAALAVELGTLGLAPNTSPEPVGRQLAAIRDQVGRLSDDLHDLAYKLHPSLLEHVGLEVALRDHLAEFTKRTGLPVTFNAREVSGMLSPEIASNLFRVMQESLQNVSKHARATEVTVKLSGSSKGIGLSVCDNGKGFDIESKDVHLKGLGLVSMQERARGLGGFLRIHSLPKAGTKVCAWIPRAWTGV